VVSFLCQGCLGNRSGTIALQSYKYNNLYKVYGKITAFLMYCAAFTFIPELLNVTIPFLNQYMELKYVYIVIVLSTITIVTIVYNLSIMFVYRSKLPFFEQYRINPKVS
jgi:hypothetical protein